MNLIRMSQRFTYIQNMHYDYDCFPSQGIRFGKKLELHIYENCDDEDEDEEEMSDAKDELMNRIYQEERDKLTILPDIEADFIALANASKIYYG